MKYQDSQIEVVKAIFQESKLDGKFGGKERAFVLKKMKITSSLR